MIAINTMVVPSQIVRLVEEATIAKLLDERFLFCFIENTVPPFKFGLHESTQNVRPFCGCSR